MNNVQKYDKVLFNIPIAVYFYFTILDNRPLNETCIQSDFIVGRASNKSRPPYENLGTKECVLAVAVTFWNAIKAYHLFLSFQIENLETSITRFF